MKNLTIQFYGFDFDNNMIISYQNKEEIKNLKKIKNSWENTAQYFNDNKKELQVFYKIK